MGESRAAALASNALAGFISPAESSTYQYRLSSTVLSSILAFTLAVLSIALLGLAMLQGGGARFVSDAAVRSQATLLAYDIIDRMRMNPDAAATYTAGDPGGACDTATASVDNDLNCWYQAIADTLPQGNGSIAQSGAAFTVVLSWRDRNTRGATAQPITQAMQVTVEL